MEFSICGPWNNQVTPASMTSNVGWYDMSLFGQTIHHYHDGIVNLGFSGSPMIRFH